MAERIIVEHRKGGGCGGFLALLLIAGLAINYWYIAAPLAIVLVAGWWWSARPAPVMAGTYECQICHADVPKGQVVCSMCDNDVRLS